VVEQTIFGDDGDISSSDGETMETLEKSKKTANTTDDQVDAEPEDVPLRHLTLKFPLISKTGQVKRSILTKWSATPKSVSETTNPCERNKLQLKIPPCPVKRSRVQAEQKTVTDPQPSTSQVVSR